MPISYDNRAFEFSPINGYFFLRVRLGGWGQFLQVPARNGRAPE